MNILGYQYGMGAGRAFAAAQEWGLKVTEDLVAKSVKTYRSTYPEIVKGWYDLERLAMAATRNPNAAFTYDHGIAFKHDGRRLLMRLPSGRCLSYNGMRITQKETPWGEIKDSLMFDTENGLTKQWQSTPTWGGTLLQGACQAIARDIMAHGMMNCEKVGLLPIGTVHDEVIVECDPSLDISVLDECLLDVPSWAKPIPLAAEGYIAQRYRK
jgi:DNA polymerase